MGFSKVVIATLCLGISPAFAGDSPIHEGGRLGLGAYLTLPDGPYIGLSAKYISNANHAFQFGAGYDLDNSDAVDIGIASAKYTGFAFDGGYRFEGLATEVDLGTVKMGPTFGAGLDVRLSTLKVEVLGQSETQTQVAMGPYLAAEWSILFEAIPLDIVVGWQPALLFGDDDSDLSADNFRLFTRYYF